MTRQLSLSLLSRSRIGGEAVVLHPGDEIPGEFRRRLDTSTAPPCVFIHAFPLDSRMWTSALECAAKEGHPALAFDLPGFGGSALQAPPPEVLSIDAAAEAVAGCLDTLGIGRAVLIGCSMGGYVIFSLLRGRPGIVSGILLADTRAAADTEVAKAGRFQAIETIASGNRRQFLSGMKDRLLAAGRSGSDATLSADLDEIMEDQSDETLMAALRGLAERADSTDLLASIRVPVSVVVGELDAIVSVDEAAALAEAIPGATLEVIAGAGHLPNMEAPGEFASALRALLERVRGSARGS